MLPLTPATAKLSDFDVPAFTLLYGEKLKDIRKLERSIGRFGLLNPIVVAREGKRMTVIDGRKRLMALRRMRFQGKLPRSLVRVPFIVVDQTRKIDSQSITNPMKLLSNAEQYKEVKRLQKRGRSISEIAKTLFTSKRHVKALLCVDKLSERLRTAFLGDSLSLDQARALATLPNPASQDALMLELGPFAKSKEILNAIARGETVLGIDEDNVIILPSRRRPESMRLAA